MAVDGDGTLIAGIPEINLFRQHPLSRTSISLHLRSIAFTRCARVCVCEHKNDMIDDRRRRGFTIDAIAGSFRGSLVRISIVFVILIVQRCPNLLNRCKYY